MLNIEHIELYVHSALEPFDERTAAPVREALRGLQDAATELVRIGLFGTSSSGKSTLINALLGDDLLPSSRQRTTPCAIEVRCVRDLDPEQPAWREVYFSFDEYRRFLELTAVRLGLSGELPPVTSDGAFVAAWRAAIEHRETTSAGVVREAVALLDAFTIDAFDRDPSRGLEFQLPDRTAFQRRAEVPQEGSSPALLSTLIAVVPMPEADRALGAEPFAYVDLPGSATLTVRDQVIFFSALRRVETVLICADHAAHGGSIGQWKAFVAAIESAGAHRMSDRAIVVATKADQLLMSPDGEPVGPDEFVRNVAPGQWRDLVREVGHAPGLPLFVAASNVFAAPAAAATKALAREMNLQLASRHDTSGLLDAIATDGSGVTELRRRIRMHVSERGATALLHGRQRALVALEDALKGLPTQRPQGAPEGVETPLKLLHESEAVLRAAARHVEAGGATTEAIERVEQMAIANIYAWPLWGDLTLTLDERGAGDWRSPPTALRDPRSYPGEAASDLQHDDKVTTMADLRRQWALAVDDVDRASREAIEDALREADAANRARAADRIERVCEMVAAAGSDATSAVERELKSFAVALRRRVRTEVIEPRHWASDEPVFVLSHRATDLPWQRFATEGGTPALVDNLVMLARTRYELARGVTEAVRDRQRPALRECGAHLDALADEVAAVRNAVHLDLQRHVRRQGSPPSMRKLAIQAVSAEIKRLERQTTEPKHQRHRGLG